jgi:hypothetical protein
MSSRIGSRSQGDAIGSREKKGGEQEEREKGRRQEYKDHRERDREIANAIKTHGTHPP